eukprot:2993758-Pyramimonas_sp.AAC.1
MLKHHPTYISISINVILANGTTALMPSPFATCPDHRACCRAFAQCAMSKKRSAQLCRPSCDSIPLSPLPP